MTWSVGIISVCNWSSSTLFQSSLGKTEEAFTPLSPPTPHLVEVCQERTQQLENSLFEQNQNFRTSIQSQDVKHYSLASCRLAPTNAQSPDRQVFHKTSVRPLSNHSLERQALILDHADLCCPNAPFLIQKFSTLKTFPGDSAWNPEPLVVARFCSTDMSSQLNNLSRRWVLLDLVVP